VLFKHIVVKYKLRIYSVTKLDDACYWCFRIKECLRILFLFLCLNTQELVLFQQNPCLHQCLILLLLLGSTVLEEPWPPQYFILA